MSSTLVFGKGQIHAAGMRGSRGSGLFLGDSNSSRKRRGPGSTLEPAVIVGMCGDAAK